MYRYKVVTIKYSSWTGKSEVDLEDTINGFAEQGWRLVQVTEFSDPNKMAPVTNLFFERPAEDL